MAPKPLVSIGDAKVLPCPKCGSLGSTDENGNLCSITDMRLYAKHSAGEKIRVRCVSCGWAGKVMLFENMTFRRV